MRNLHIQIRYNMNSLTTRSQTKRKIGREVGVVLIMIFILGCTRCPEEISPISDRNSEGTLGVDVREEFLFSFEGTQMPVLIEGNTQSEIFILFLHGGPGSSGILESAPTDNPFDRLAQKYAVVYYDQRCSGSNPTPCTENILTVERFVLDLEALIAEIKVRYGNSIQIFLMGHSWGGSLGIAYLADQERQANVQGWIEVDGGHNIPVIVSLSQDRIRELGQTQIDLGNNVGRWEELIRESEQVDLLDLNSILTVNRASRQAEDLMREVDSVLSNTSENNRCLTRFRNQIITQDDEVTVNLISEELIRLNLTPILPDIQIPSLLMWGKFDVRVPLAFGLQEFELYGTPNKDFVIFEQSAHFPFRQERVAFAEAVSSFIEEFKR